MRLDVQFDIERECTGLNAKAWLNDALARIASHFASRLDELPPSHRDQQERLLAARPA